MACFFHSVCRQNVLFSTVQGLQAFIAKIFRNTALTDLGWRAGHAVLRVLDALGLGMVLNGYFRKA